MLSSPSTSHSNFLIMVGGASGIGKTTTLEAMITHWPEKYARPKCFTTRKERPNEGREYQFVSHEKILTLHESGSLVALDVAYGEFYGISTHSLTELAAAGIWPVKEIHPDNQLGIRKNYPNSISVLLDICDDEKQQHTVLRDERNSEDNVLYRNLDKTQFDIIHTITLGDTVATAKGLHRTLNTFIKFRDVFPAPAEIDALNRIGYDKVAEEFDDKHRITTRNFHDLSGPFLRQCISEYVLSGCRCLEIGPGNGWLRKSFHWPSINYVAVDLSPKMNGNSPIDGSSSISARHLPYQSQSFDVVFASLADPFLYHTAFCEISRVLKPSCIFICTFPSYRWARALRTPSALHFTKFTLKSGREARAFSFALDQPTFESMVHSAGFSIVSRTTATGTSLPKGTVVSEALLIGAQHLGLDLANLPILDGYVLRKDAF